ncbi:eukaryotic huntingtin interacting protein B [Legionella quinlivanii]|uniref:Eukaryotic huntingtin interacting protein B n=1 Tax=Legionella quinlivanii TaxID=45073 RepID=A0A0W0XL26_9GAMM|nr:SET domain-containing protein-lysine N-methyltransferase [Legionella quinlivanii]KTD45260.1 eukaryotic huntingtin interacting protein B [Legionella quinlivanii]MCW8450383.1 SET domain-containing protein-lysine N-methyltransferase [Legionella quinlivanii]SEG03519.1 SET domain-containing protein [Legionella quinlivanii DSM 21216]STY11440.1 eukaryotic huntingtin interacting protein B [Legionella quinlivanii]
MIDTLLFDDKVVDEITKQHPEMPISAILEFIVFHELKKHYSIEDWDLADTACVDYQTIIALYNRLKSTIPLVIQNERTHRIILDKVSLFFALVKAAEGLLKSAITVSGSIDTVRRLPDNGSLSNTIKEESIQGKLLHSRALITMAYNLISTRETLSRNHFEQPIPEVSEEDKRLLKYDSLHSFHQLPNHLFLINMKLWESVYAKTPQMIAILNSIKPSNPAAPHQPEANKEREVIEDISDEDQIPASGNENPPLISLDKDVDFDRLSGEAFKEPLVFHMDDEDHQKQLALEESFTYTHNSSDLDSKLDVTGINLLFGGKGVLARTGIKAKEIFCVYEGMRISEDDVNGIPKEELNTHYFMRLGQSKTIIDARLSGNVARFFNESKHTPNAEFRKRPIKLEDGRISFEIVVMAIRDIEPGEQILVNYSDDYDYGDIQRVFLHHSDGPYNSKQLLHKYQQEYSKTAVLFRNKGENEETHTPGELNGLYFDAVEKAILPVALADILAGKKEVRTLEHPDLPVLFITPENELQENNTTERLSSLMIASYLGLAEGVEALLKMKADPAMQSRRAGLSSFHMVMAGEYYGVSSGDAKSRRKIIELFKKEKVSLMLEDDDGLTVFDWALRLKTTECLEELIKDLRPTTFSKLLEHKSSASDKLTSLMAEGKLAHCQVILKKIGQKSYVYSSEIKKLFEEWTQRDKLKSSKEATSEASPKMDDETIQPRESKRQRTSKRNKMGVTDASFFSGQNKKRKQEAKGESRLEGSEKPPALTDSGEETVLRIRTRQKIHQETPSDPSPGRK